MKRTFDSIIADFKKEAAVDFIGFWELVGTVKTYYEDDESGESTDVNAGFNETHAVSRF
jgi:hypothetical protein